MMGVAAPLPLAADITATSSSHPIRRHQMNQKLVINSADYYTLCSTSMKGCAVAVEDMKGVLI